MTKVTKKDVFILSTLTILIFALIVFAFSIGLSGDRVLAQDLAPLATSPPSKVAAVVTATPLLTFGDMTFGGVDFVQPGLDKIDPIKNFIVVQGTVSGGYGYKAAGLSTFDPNVMVPVIRGGIMAPPCLEGVTFYKTGYGYSSEHPGYDGTCGQWGTPLVAPTHGLVVASGFVDGNHPFAASAQNNGFWVSGYTVILKTILADPDGSNPREIMWGVGHMTGADMPEVGRFIRAGQVIGQVGATGFVSGSGGRVYHGPNDTGTDGTHAHAFMTVDGVWVNPVDFGLLGPGINPLNSPIFGGDACTYTQDQQLQFALEAARARQIPEKIFHALMLSESNLSHCDGAQVKINSLGAIGGAQIYLHVHPSLNPNDVLYDVPKNYGFGGDDLVAKYNSASCSSYAGDDRWYCAVSRYKGITGSDFRTHPHFQIFWNHLLAMP